MKKVIIFLTLILSTILFSKNLVVTGTQATYTIANLLTKDTNIEVEDVFETSQSMGTDQLNALKKLNLSKYKEAKAVITLSRIWNDDTLYEHLRRENIFIVEIDASYSYQDNSSLALLIDNYRYDKSSNEPNPFVWLNLNNLKKMLIIVANDLKKIFPKEANVIQKNLSDSLKLVEKLNFDYNELNNIDGAIVLNENLNYLVSFLNIYNKRIAFTDINIDNVVDIMKQTGLNTFFTEKPLKKNIIEKIKENGGKVLTLKTASFPEEDDEDEEKLNKYGLIKIIEENLNKLKK